MMKQKVPNKHPLIWLCRRCRAQLPLLGIVVFCNVLLSASAVYLALLVRDVIDLATAAVGDPASLENLYAVAQITGLVILFQLVFRFLCRYLGEKLTALVEVSLRSQLYRSLLERDFGKVSAYHSGELMTRLYSDITVISDGATTILPNLAAIVTRLVCAVFVMALLEWRFTLLFVGGGLIIFAISRLFSRFFRKLHFAMQEADGKARSFMQESFSSLLVLKAFDAGKVTADKSARLQNEHYSVKVRKKLVGAIAGVGFSSVFKIGYFAALLYCSLSLAGVAETASLMTYGTMMAILQLVNQIQAPLGSLSGIMPKFYGMCASVERLQELENIPLDKREIATSQSAAEFYQRFRFARFEDVSFAYEREEVLSHASLEINKGDFCVITGLSGIGKSTLLKLLLGVYEPTQGKISLSTEDGEVSVHARARGLFAYVPQGNMLFSGSIRENIAFVKTDATEDEIMEAARLACVTDFLPDLPEGLDTVIGEKGFGLSEGQVQRISIARALLLGSPILLLDESTSALDEQTEHKLLKSLSELTEKTLIIISHKRASFEICSHEIVISDKRITKKELGHEHA